MKKALAILGVVAAMAPVNVMNASAEDVEFNGTVSTACTVVVNNGGTLAQASGGNVLSSKATGGAAGAATVTATGYGYQVSVAAPTAWDAGTTAAASFDADFNIGGTDYTSAQTVGLGDTSVGVNLVATAAANTSFANGSYTATVVLTCS